MKPPQVSLILPAKNSEKTLGKCLESIAKLDYEKDRMELIIVVGKSKDRTCDIAKSFCESEHAFPVKLVCEEGEYGGGFAINKGFEEADGEIIALTNADCFVESNWLGELIKPFKDASIGGVGGRVTTFTGSSLLQKIIGREMESRFACIGEYMRAPQDANLAWRRETFAAVGGYDPSFKVAYDADMGYRVFGAGWKIAYRPTALVQHYNRDNLSEYWFQLEEGARYMVRISRKHPERIVTGNEHARRLPTAEAIAGMVSLFGLLWASLTGSSALLYAGLFSVFVLSFVSTAIVFSKVPDTLSLSTAFVSFFRSFAYGKGLLLGLLDGAREGFSVRYGDAAWVQKFQS